MSESAISAIYKEIANFKISNVKSRNIDKINLIVKDADLPCRMLLPSTSGELSFVGIGSLNNITWVIRDLCLWAPLTAGSGIEQFADSMVGYIRLYVAAIKAHRNPTNQSNITGIALQMGPIPWAEKDYWAIDVTLTIEEIL